MAGNEPYHLPRTEVLTSATGKRPVLIDLANAALNLATALVLAYASRTLTVIKGQLQTREGRRWDDPQ